VAMITAGLSPFESTKLPGNMVGNVPPIP
jgi:hypothetical protein